MQTILPEPTAQSPVGALLKQWRAVRRKSQLTLALDADVSARHLSFVESGRSQPSRQMVLRLAQALEVPLRERNGLLVAAGYAPLYRESGWTEPDLAPVQRAIERILRQQEPYPAVVMDRHWNLIHRNDAAARFFGWLLGAAPTGPINVLRSMFDPARLRPYVTNWDAVGEALIQRLHREALGGVPDGETARLLAELLTFPGVPARWRAIDLAAAPTPVIAVDFRKDGVELRYFSTVTTLGTPQDVRLQEMRIECFFPVDEATERRARELAER